jgi:hypothetical protein
LEDTISAVRDAAFKPLSAFDRAPVMLILFPFHPKDIWIIAP